MAGRHPSGGKGVGLGAAALLLAASGLLSRILGYGREVLLAYFAGVGPETDAYFSAFVLPDLLNYLLAGGALSIAFLPLYTRARERGGEAEAADLFRTTLGNMGFIVVLVTALLWWQADRLVGLQFPQYDPETRRLTTEITRIVLPAQVFFVLGGVIKATLFARGRFGAAALAPLVYNLAIIAGGALLYERIGIHGFAWGVLVGAICGPFLAPLVDSFRDGRPGLRISFLDPRFRRYLWVAAPLMFGQSLLTVDEWFDKWFGALIQPGAVAWLSYARRLMLLPVAVVGQAIATAALPTLSRLWEQGERREMDRTVIRTLRVGLGLALLTGAGLAALADPVVQLVYARGAWASQDSAVVSDLLRVLAWAVPGWIVQQIAVRPFYARGDTWRPMVLGTVVVLLALPLYRGLALGSGVQGLAWAGVIGMTGNALATIFLARRLHGAPPFGELGASGLRSLGIALPAGLAAFLASRDLGPRIASWIGLVGSKSEWPAVSIDLLAGGGAFVLATSALLPLLGDPEMKAWIARRLRRRARS